MRLIQATHPDIDFDWPQILKGKQEPQPERPRQDQPSRTERPPRAADKPDRRNRPRPAPAPEPRAAEPETAAPESGPAAARLGSAGLQRLRARFTEIVARIQARVEDQGRRAELSALAVRLNPDEWATDAAVVAGLEGYEATYEELKNAIGGRRKPPAPAEAAQDEGHEDPAPAPPQPDEDGPI